MEMPSLQQGTSWLEDIENQTAIELLKDNEILYYWSQIVHQDLDLFKNLPGSSYS